MIIIGRKKLIEFSKRHSLSRVSLSSWETIITETNYSGFNALKLTFPSVDYVYHRYTIFDISGNKYRLITEIDYPTNVVHIKIIWTHAEYSMKKNQDALRRGKL